MNRHALLCRHQPSDEVCFGEAGSRDAGQLLAYAARISNQLSGLAPGARVVLACRDRYRFSAVLVAALHRGLVMCFPESSEPAAIVSALREGGATELLHDQPSVSEGVNVAELEEPNVRRTAALPCATALDQVAFIALTSGSTGSPQAHKKSLGQLVVEASSHGEQFDLLGARIVSAVPAHHIYGLLFGILSPLLAGGSTLRETVLFPDLLMTAVVDSGARGLVAVPTHLATLAQQTELELPAIDRVFSSAGPLSPSVATALAERGMTITEIFGSTELGGVAYRQQLDAPWQPMLGVSLRVAADDTLQVRSKWATAAPAAQEWVGTSDRIQLIDGGGFVHLGRADSVVKIGGRRIDLRDLELQLQRVQNVREARVIAVQHAGAARDLALWAVVAGSDVTVETLRSSLAERFNQVTWPRRYRVVQNLPRGETGKVTRRALLALFDDVAPSAAATSQAIGARQVPSPKSPTKRIVSKGARS